MIRAGQELNFFGDQAQNTKQLTTQTNSFRYVPSETIGASKCIATKTGILKVEPVQSKKHPDRVKVDVVPLNTNKYLHPRVNDLVIGIVVGKQGEFFSVDINSDTPALLHCQEHQGATQKDFPRYAEGTLLYCRVLETNSSSGLARTKLSCISPLCKKAWNSGEAFFGDLKGGLVKDFPIGFSRTLLESKEDILEKLGAKVKFRINIGFNGRIWVDARIADTIFIMTCLERAAIEQDTKSLFDLINKF